MSGLDNTSYTVRTASGTTDTMTANDSVVIYTNSGAKTVVLPAVTAIQPGREYSLICTNTGVLTIDPQGADNINGSATFAMTAGTVGGVTGRCTIISDGTQWFTLNSQ